MYVIQEVFMTACFPLTNLILTVILAIVLFLREDENQERKTSNLD